jgi:hypothetical protein
VGRIEGGGYDRDTFLAGITANERRHALGDHEAQPRKSTPVTQTEENLMNCLNARGHSRPMPGGVGNQRLLYRRSGRYWQEWYANATNWTQEKAAKKWRMPRHRMSYTSASNLTAPARRSRPRW